MANRIGRDAFRPTVRPEAAPAKKPTTQVSRATVPEPRDEFVADAVARQARAQALGGVDQCTPADAVTPATIAAATTRAADADEAVKKLDQQLAAELQGLGEALTPEQQQAYTAEFRAKHGYDAAVAAQQAAHEALRDLLASPELRAKMAQAPDGNTIAVAAAEGLEQLAGGPLATDAVMLLGEFQGYEVAGPSYRGAFSAYFEDTTARILEKAAPAAFAQLASSAETPEAAADAFKALFRPFSNSPEVKKAFALVDDIIASGDPVEAFARGVDGASDGFGAVGYLLTAFKLGAGGARVAGGVRGADLARLTSLFESGRVPNGIAVRAIGAVGRMLKLPGAEKVAARFVPALGALFAAKSVIERLAKDDKNVGDYIGIAGDVAMLVGNGLTASVVGAPLGLIISGIGAVVGFIGDLISGNADRAKLEAARRETLQALADRGEFDPALIEVYATKAERLGELATVAEVSPEDLAYLVRNWPGDIASIDPQALKLALGNYADSEDVGSGFYLLGTVRLGLSVEQVVDLARAGFAQTFTDAGQLLVLQEVKRKFKLDSRELVDFLKAGVSAEWLQSVPPEDRGRLFLQLGGPAIDAGLQDAVDSADPRAWVELLRSRGFDEAAAFLEGIGRR